MARTPNRRQREAARQRSQAAAEARQVSTRRRQRIIAVAIVAVVVLSIGGAVLGSRSSSKTPAATSTTTSAPVATTNPALPATGVAPEPAPMGETLTGAAPCPAEDGSSPRVTLFSEAPPTCIDPTYFYVATIRTTKGDLSVQLNPKRAPVTVNAFVVLSRYHFYDGQPVTSVRTREAFTIGLAFTGPGAAEAPGFTVPVEAAAQGSVMVPGLLSMVPSGSPAAGRGELLIATFERAPAIDPGVVTFGAMLSGEDTLTAIDSLATSDGQPAEAVSITSVSITRTSPIPT
jgi:cyclophilin family peptidyl-prolyl cis-trans isomerase